MKFIADIEPQAGEIILVLHWAGGVHTELRLPRRRRGQRNSTAVEIIEAVRVLVRIADDNLIAGLLNRNRLATGHGNRWTRERVTSLRSHHKIPVYSRQARDSEGLMTLTHGAAKLAPRRCAWPPNAARSRLNTRYPMVLGSSTGLLSRLKLPATSRSASGEVAIPPRDTTLSNKTSIYQ